MSGPGPLALVVNPAATLVRGGIAERARRALAPHGLEWDLATRGPGDAAQMARRAAAEGAAVVVALGGDGTAAEVAGALAGGTVAAAILPGGNANVFCRALGWPATPLAALAALEEALRAGRRRVVRLGTLRAGGAGHRVFAVNAGVGLDAETVAWIESRPALKHRLRQGAYAIGAGRAVLHAGRRPRIRVEADGAPALAAGALLSACGSPYTYLGRRPLDLAPGADFDGRIAWTALLRVRPGELAALLTGAALGRPLPVGGRALAGGLAGRLLVARADAPVAVQADGEPLGRHEEVRISPGPALVAVAPRGALKSGGRAPT